MTPEELVSQACPKIGSLGSAFYFAPETVTAGEAIGLDVFQFYFLGRGGVLGDVEPRVVTSAFGYFNPSLVETMWNAGRAKVQPRDAGRAHLEACRAFGRARLGELPGLDAFCQAAEAVNDAADPAGLALYAGISAEPLPEDLPGRAMQLVAVLREYRGSVHLLAVLASGLEPKVAHYLRRPSDLGLFGWPTDHPPEVTEAERRALAEADALTDRLVLRAYGVLDEGGRQALLDGLVAMEGAIA